MMGSVSDLTQDPLGHWSSYPTPASFRRFIGPSGGSGRHALAISAMLLNLLFPVFLFDSMFVPEQLSPEVVATKRSQIVTILQGDWTDYLTRGISVGIADRDLDYLSLDEYLANITPSDRDYGLLGTRWAATWYAMLYAGLETQQLVFRIYNGIEESVQTQTGPRTKALRDLAEVAVSDFEEFYNLDILSPAGSVYYRDVLDSLKSLYHLDRYYSIFKDKLQLLTADVAEEQRQAQLKADSAQLRANRIAAAALVITAFGVILTFVFLLH